MIGHRLGHRLGHALGHLLANHALSVGGLKTLNFATGTVFSSNNAAGGTPGKPATISGDLLVMVIVSTSAPTAPAGWTLVASQTDVNFTQQLNVYTAPYNVAGSTACSQATAGPFCAVVLRVRGNHGGVLSVGTIGSASGNSTANPEPMASVTPSVDGTVLALGASSGQSASTSPVYTPSSGWTNLPPSGNFRWRLGMAIRAYKAGVASSGSFASTGYAAGSSSSWNKLAIVFKET